MPKTGFKRLKRGDLANLHPKRQEQLQQPFMGRPLVEQNVAGGPDAEKVKKAAEAKVNAAEGQLQAAKQENKKLQAKVAELQKALDAKPAEAEEVEVEVVPAELQVKRVAKVRPAGDNFKIVYEVEDEDEAKTLLIPKGEASKFRRMGGEEEPA